jgi:cytochrome P450
VKQLFNGFNEFAEINQTGTAALIDFYPILRYLPDFVIPTQKRAKELFKVERKLYVGHWLNTKEAIRNKTAKPCFCVDMARVQEKEGFSDDQAGYISGTLLEAGSDTTSSTLYAFVQAMLVFPEVQKRAQEEIDRVVGPNRLPTMDDEMDLQYIRGIVKETLRWFPTTILGAVPHAVTRDDEYMGYLIPKGAGVLNNVYTIHMDPARHPNPRQFDPLRYKDDFLTAADSAANPDGTKRDHFTFGAGRRICQGMHVADRSLFLGVSRMLWGFNIRPVKNEAGEDIIPDIDQYTQGFVCMPVEFPVDIKPRDERRAEIIRNEWKEAQTLLDQTKQWKEIPQGMALPSLD